MSVMVEVDGGELEFIPTPGAVNLIATDGSEECELRLSAEGLTKLRQGVRENEETNVEVEGGIVAWEPERGLYVEDAAGASFYVVLAPLDREALVEKTEGLTPLA
jgi:hypothetical protein